MHTHFLIIPLPTHIQSTLARCCHGLPQVRWMEQENFHLMIHNFGPLPDHAAGMIDAQLAPLFFNSFPLVLRGMDHFHSKNHGSIWTGLGLDHDPQINLLKKEIQTHLRPLQLKREERTLPPHVVMGFYDGLSPQRLGDYLLSHADFQSPPFEVTSVALMCAIQTPKRTLYEIIGEYPASPNATGED